MEVILLQNVEKSSPSSSGGVVVDGAGVPQVLAFIVGGEDDDVHRAESIPSPEPQEVRQVARVVTEVDSQFGHFKDFNVSGFTA